MARPIWSGAVSFGLVNVPVRLFPATRPLDVRFHQFEEASGKRIEYKRVAEGSDKEVPWEGIVKGYEVAKDRYVMVTPEELEAVEPGRSRTIEIEDFVDLEEIDPIYYEKTYYLAPAKNAGAERPYELLRRAMEEAGKVGIARFVLRSKEYLAAVRPIDGLLGLETMFFADEVLGRDEVENLPKGVKVSPKELSIAERLIDSLTVEWRPESYHDTYRERVLDLIERKRKGEEIVVERPPELPEVPDIMSALVASVEEARKRREARATRTRKAAGSGRRRRKAS